MVMDELPPGPLQKWIMMMDKFVQGPGLEASIIYQIYLMQHMWKIWSNAHFGRKSMSFNICEAFSLFSAYLQATM